jgi:hypothetical protein
MKIRLIRLITIGLASLCLQIYGGIALFGSMFVLDAAPEDRWMLWVTIFGMPCCFAIFVALQTSDFYRHQGDIFSFLLSILMLTISVIHRDYLLWGCGELIVFGFYGSVLVLGCLSLYISLNSGTQQT